MEQRAASLRSGRNGNEEMLRERCDVVLALCLHHQPIEHLLAGPPLRDEIGCPQYAQMVTNCWLGHREPIADCHNGKFTASQHVQNSQACDIGQPRKELDDLIKVLLRDCRGMFDHSQSHLRGRMLPASVSEQQHTRSNRRCCPLKVPSLRPR